MPRVRRLTDRKIFNDPRSAARASEDVTVKDVIWCCDGYIREVAGVKYEWMFEKLPERTYAEKSYYKRVGKYKDPARRGYVRFLLPPLRLWVEDFAPIPISISIKTFLPMLKPYVDNYYDFEWVITAAGLSKHFKSWIIVYEKIIGMKLSQKRISKRTLTYINFYPPEVMLEYDAQIEISEIPARGYPVIRLNDCTIFNSLRHAGRYTGIIYYTIDYCCLGDIPYVMHFGMKYRFSYLRSIPVLTYDMLNRQMQSLNRITFRIYYDTSVYAPANNDNDEPIFYTLTLKDKTKFYLMHPTNEESFKQAFKNVRVRFNKITATKFVDEKGEFQWESLEK